METQEMRAIPKEEWTAVVEDWFGGSPGRGKEKEGVSHPGEAVGSSLFSYIFHSVSALPFIFDAQTGVKQEFYCRLFVRSCECRWNKAL